MAENVVGKSKFEIMVDLMKALNVSSFDLKEIEKYLKKIKAVPDENGGYSEAVSKAVVDHFKLEKGLEKSDKSMISALKKQVKNLTAQNQELRDQVAVLTAVKSAVDKVNINLQKGFDGLSQQIKEATTYTDEDITGSSVPEDQSNDQQDDYQFDDYNSDAESSSQQ